jgi:hypothetical protein
VRYFRIASGAKQSITAMKVDCFVASLLAMTKNTPRLNGDFKAVRFEMQRNLNHVRFEMQRNLNRIRFETRARFSLTR